MAYSELPTARILADVREPNTLIDDQLFDLNQFEFVDSFRAYDANRFLIRNADASDEQLLALALHGHPARLRFRIFPHKRTSTEDSSLYVELYVKDTLEKKRPLQVLQECFEDLAQLFVDVSQKVASTNQS